MIALHLGPGGVRAQHKSDEHCGGDSLCATLIVPRRTFKSVRMWFDDHAIWAKVPPFFIQVDPVALDRASRDDYDAGFPCDP